ncbi:MAG TPA: hypothetical protein VIT22_01830 [Pseudoxanthomonas sp.]
MGGGGKAPKTPDYTPVINSIKESLKWTQGQSEAAIKWATEAYAKNRGTADIYINNALGFMDKLTGDYEEAQADWQKYRPLADEQINEARRLSSAEAQEEAAGRAEQDTDAAIRQRTDALTAKLEGMGVPPGTARSVWSQLASQVMGGGQMAAAGNKARLDQQAAGRAAVAEALGQGNTTRAAGNAAAQLGLGAGQSAVTAGNQSDATFMGALGNPQGWSAQTGQGNATWADTLNAGFANAMDRYKAQQEEGGGLGQILGLGASIAGKAFGLPFAQGGAIPDSTQMFANGGGPLPPEMSPTGGAIPDDIPAEIAGSDGSTQPAQLSAGEFVVPKDVMGWMGEKGMQQIILKARKEMTGGNGERPAQPTEGPPPGPGYDGAGAIPAPAGVA